MKFSKITSIEELIKIKDLLSIEKMIYMLDLIDQDGYVEIDKTFGELKKDGEY